MDKTVTIVGGGLAGLATAYFLKEGVVKSDLHLETTVVESESRLGGRVETEFVDGCVIEAGPDSFLTLKPQAVDLCEKLGLSELLIGTNSARSKVYVLVGGKLRRLPDGLTSVVPKKLTPFLWTNLLTPWGKTRMLLDVLVPRRKDVGDESLAGFVRRRLGHEALERIAEPLMAGIYAGDAEHLSMSTNFPQLVQLEAKRRSLVLGTLENSRHPVPGEGQRVRRPTFMSLRGGLGQMVDALVSQLKDARIFTGKRPIALKRAGTAGEERYELALDDGTVIGSRSVVLATPAYASAELLKDLSPEASAILGSIPYVSTATVSLIFDRATFPLPLDGSGFVIAPNDNRKITACTWVSSKWPTHSPSDRVLLRCFLGRAGHEEVLQRGDDELCQLAQDELNSILGISALPLQRRLHRCGKSLAQYNLGHSDKLKALDEAMEKLPGVFLTGSAYRGVGLPDCIKQAGLAASEVVGFLAGGQVSGTETQRMVAGTDRDPGSRPVQGN
ncbi:MAG: protoporphyrinogen oxidase [Nitrososphaerales archaeon]|jgi:oxygen-dependent protoporphyrinogen oxidase